MGKSPLLAVVGICTAGLLLSGCTTEAKDVNKNLTKDADNFKIERRVSLINTRTNMPIVVVEGKCSVETQDSLSATVLCKTDDGKYVRHGFLRSTDTTMVWEQLQASDTSAAHYRFVYRSGGVDVSVAPNK
jgi:hypothetical protein